MGSNRQGLEEDYQRSLQALTVAVNEYSWVLRIYTDLTAEGKIPVTSLPSTALDPQRRALSKSRGRLL